MSVLNLDELLHLAQQAYRNGNLQDAWRYCDQVLERHPLHADALNLMAALALCVHQHEEARRLCSLILEGDPGNQVALLNLGSSLHGLGLFGEALEVYERVTALDEASAAAWYNKANTLKAMGLLEQACGSFDQATRCKDDYVEAHYNWANTLHQMRRFADAVSRFGVALQIAPAHQEARKNRAFSRLMVGDYLGGWEDLEARWHTPPLNETVKSGNGELWTGAQPLEGRSIHLHAEQGLGDTLQFCRYVRLVKELGASLVVLEVQRPLLALLKNLKGVDVLVPEGQPVPALDYHCPLMSLPRAFRTTVDSIPDPHGYLDVEAASPNPWSAMLGPDSFNIGICWVGSVKGQEVGKSIPLAMFRRFVDLAGVRLYSLQKNALAGISGDAEDIQWLHRFDDAFDSAVPFIDSATVMRSLDLVISTDTSVAHLAAAMGVPVWVALPWLCDWRWGATGCTTPWYQAMRLFRQTQPGEWADCFNEMRTALEEVVV